jgi:hypothetical protein
MKSLTTTSGRSARIARIGLVLICGSLASCEQILDRLKTDIHSMKQSATKVDLPSDARMDKESERQPASAQSEIAKQIEKNIQVLVRPAAEVSEPTNSMPSNKKISPNSPQQEVVSNGKTLSEKPSKEKLFSENFPIKKVLGKRTTVKPDSSSSNTQGQGSSAARPAKRAPSIQIIDEDGNISVSPSNVEKKNGYNVYIDD